MECIYLSLTHSHGDFKHQGIRASHLLHQSCLIRLQVLHGTPHLYFCCNSRDKSQLSDLAGGDIGPGDIMEAPSNSSPQNLIAGGCGVHYLAVFPGSCVRRVIGDGSLGEKATSGGV